MVNDGGSMGGSHHTNLKITDISKQTRKYILILTQKWRRRDIRISAADPKAYILKCFFAYIFVCFVGSQTIAYSCTVFYCTI